MSNPPDLMLSRMRELHHMVQESDPFAYSGDQHLVSCSCRHGNVVHIWREGDAEPDWRCPTLKLLDEYESGIQ